MTAAALPDLWTSLAMATPSPGLLATLAVARANPAFRMRASATGPCSPPKTSSSIWAFTLASPPLRSSISQLGIPKSFGKTLYSFTPAWETSMTSAGPAGVSSSIPIEFTTRAFSKPSSFNASAMSFWTSLEYTPTRAYGTEAGFNIGPKRLNAVLTLRDFLTGTTAFMAGWNRGANMNPMPASARHCSICSGPRSITTPRFSRTSALPHRLETDLLPCLATVRPHAAVRTQAPVEIFTVPALSPPVPTMSTAVSFTVTGDIFSFIAEASPAISEAVSPFARSSTRKAAIFAGSPSSTRWDNMSFVTPLERFWELQSCSNTAEIWTSPTALGTTRWLAILLLALRP
mmetsp:Transcript_11402/g.34722  ORF Transcript_11402/g.34722 Transcript_11402/m.34722 type:complete len:346 (+) Transcript_11402:145-1182(+)